METERIQVITQSPMINHVESWYYKGHNGVYCGTIEIHCSDGTVRNRFEFEAYDHICAVIIMAAHTVEMLTKHVEKGFV